MDHAIKARVQKKELIAVHSHVRLPVMGLVVANKYKGEIKSITDLKGRELDRLITDLETGETASLRGVRCSGGPEWRFTPAGKRR